MSPFFSIVIPTYNRVDLLQITLDSIWAQTFKDYEIIVIDDGSTDSSVEYLESLGDRLTFIQQENSGPGAARNRGIKQAAGQFIAFLDSDDTWFPWTLEEYHSSITETGADIVFGKPFLFKETTECATIKQSASERRKFSDYYESGDQWRWWGVSSFVIKRSLLNKAAFAEEKINAEDADLMMQLGIQGSVCQVLAPYTFGYRQHESNLTTHSDKSWQGILHLVNTEKLGHYPGGSERRSDRLRILLRHIKPTLLSAAKSGQSKPALQLFGSIFGWLAAQKQFRFIVGFTIHLAVGTLKNKAH